MKKFFSLVFFLTSSFPLLGDITISPGNMGPQALPIRSVGKVSLTKWGSVGLALETGGSIGEEFSISPVLTALLPWSQFAALVFKVQALEYYHTSEKLRKDRSALTNSGWSIGDMYFGSKFHIFTNKKEKFQLYLNFLTKTPTGQGRENARHTRSLRYQIDVSFRKDDLFKKLFPLDDYPFSPFIPTAIAGYTGLSTWQTAKDAGNDAFCWGLSLIYGDEKFFSYRFEMKGYIGWRNNGDRPLAGSFELVKHYEKWDLHGSYQYGFKDYATHSFTLGLKYKYYVKPAEI